MMVMMMIRDDDAFVVVVVFAGIGQIAVQIRHDGHCLHDDPFGIIVVVSVESVMLGQDSPMLVVVVDGNNTAAAADGR